MFNKIRNRFYFVSPLFVFFLTVVVGNNTAFTQTLDSFQQLMDWKEQETTMHNAATKVTININAPLHFSGTGKTYLIFYALPNGNSIEWTKGKKINEKDDWHFDIQHIAAQTRFVRELDKRNNYIIAYLMTDQKSWPAWKRSYPNAIYEIRKLVDSISRIFSAFEPALVLASHSGGGSFLFGYIDAVEKIPGVIERLVFLDSDYGYEDSLHTSKLSQWLASAKKNRLVVLSYNDSVVIYNGKPLVSPTGGTWYRSKLMQQRLSRRFKFRTSEDTSFIRHSALNGRIKIILKQNPRALIYHTVQVEKNGFIYGVLSDTRFDRVKYFTYFGERAYEGYIQKQ